MNTQNISFRDVSITDGFWKHQQDVNATVTIHAVHDRFDDTGRFGALKFMWKEGDAFKPHIFWDSDVAKWIESAAYILQKRPDALLEQQVDEAVARIAKNQWEDGYFNSYFCVVEPEKRFSNRDRHELYCAGHFIEAAIAYDQATGKDTLLRCMLRYAALIDRVFRVEHSAAFRTPGHEEIEIALVRLGRYTGDRRWLDLAKYFIDQRGQEEEVLGVDWANPTYYQSHLPCREQVTAQGHSVRACYLYTAMADIALAYQDDALKQACEALFDDITLRKMYITGGVGQSSAGEAFTVPYDLNNTHAYTETCAGIALAMFALRMQRLDADGRYGDLIERAIYNGILSGRSVDGRSFFYENPLEVNVALRRRNVSMKNNPEHFPPCRRVEVFGCSCCPPNITRFIASVGDYIYGQSDSTLLVHQYISSETETDGIRISMKSGFPWNGNVILTVNGGAGKRLALRIPAFSADAFSLMHNGTPAVFTLEKGYAYLDLTGTDEIALRFDMTPRAVYGDPRIDDDAGRCAILAGPIVYCAEGLDNEGTLRGYRIPEHFAFRFEENAALGTRDLILEAEKQSTEPFANRLYAYERKFVPATLRMIPYYAFANRDECDMSVWLMAR